MTRGCAAASTLLVSRAFLSAAACARGKARRLSELQDPTQAVERAYICELYASPSHAKLPAHIRAEQLFELLITALEQVHVDGWWPGGVLRTPSFVRCGRRVDEPRVNEASLDLGAVGRVEVPSRRHADSTPAAKVQPVRALPAERTRPEQVAHFRFYHEAVAQLGAVMAQLHDAASASSRLVAELRFLSRATSVDHGKAVDELNFQEDPKAFAALFQRMLRASHLHVQLVAATDALEERAKALNMRMPGEPFGDAHELYSAMPDFVANRFHAPVRENG